jgi:sigma-B regulation protein RsbU (phosphoserine phosphatase)
MTHGADNTATVTWISTAAVPAALQQAVGSRWSLQTVAPEQLRPTVFSQPGVAVVDAACAQLPRVLLATDADGVATILLGPSNGLPEDIRPPIETGTDLGAAELAGMLTAAMALAPSLHRLHADAQEAIRSADELDEEMRIASKLQQDFLPRRLPTVGDMRFAVLYRPASWVSGDIYDVARLDEQHVGFYVADAVGHGMPAALLTMFIKEAMQTKRISGRSYELVPPEEALAALNGDLCSQRLSMCEFCTAVYAIVNAVTGELTISRAGHPAPLLIEPGGNIQPLELPGPLLGVMDDAEYESRRLTLEPGQRLVFYSDGVEDAVCGKGNPDLSALMDLLGPSDELPRDELVMTLSDRLDTLNCEDDVTVLLVERQ